METDEIFKPGFIEMYAGCMNSGKGKKLFIRADNLDYEKNPDSGKRGIPYIVVKPKIDTRSAKLQSRFYPKEREAIYFSEDKPSEIFNLVERYEPKVVFGDELQFVKDAKDGYEIEDVFTELARQGYHIIGAGLNQNFRGEPYGRMPFLLSIAHVHSEYAICDYRACQNIATKTQRLVDGWPALYGEPTDSVEGEKRDERYEARCLFHHYVPKTRSDLEEYIIQEEAKPKD